MLSVMAITIPVDGTTKNYRDRTFDNEPDAATLQTGSGTVICSYRF